MADCSKPGTCASCSSPTVRIFTADFQLTTQPTYLREENRPENWLAPTVTDQMAAMREDEREYNNRKPVGPGGTRPEDL